MALSNGDRALRRVTAWGLVWALAFLIPYGVLTRAILAPMILIPQGISFLVAIYHLSGKATCRQFNIVLDAGLAASLIPMIVACNIAVRRNWHYRGQDLIMLGTYGCVPAMINAFVPILFTSLWSREAPQSLTESSMIHAYFSLRESCVISILSIGFGNMFSSPTCPHCQRETLFKWGMAGSNATPSESSVSKESYVSIRRQDDDEVEGRPSSSKGPMVESYRDPRPSTDDESARLV